MRLLSTARAELSIEKLRPGNILGVRIPVSNTGNVAADEVVQLYVRDLVGSITRPVRELKGFRRIHLLPGGVSSRRVFARYERSIFLQQPRAARLGAWCVRDLCWRQLAGAARR